MQEVKCKATTKAGTQCKMKANSSGYCHIHNTAQREAEPQSPKILKYEIPKHRFSQRKGYSPIATTLQTESMSIELQNSLWNVLRLNSFNINNYSRQLGLFFQRFMGNILQKTYR